jgi:hypothetical protein
MLDPPDGKAFSGSCFAPSCHSIPGGKSSKQVARAAVSKEVVTYF